MTKFYVVETINELTVTRNDYHVDAETAQEAVDYVKEMIGDSISFYTITNVYVETDEIWEG